MNKKYSIAGENNPNWQLAEPAILKIWAEGISKASYSQLYLIHFMALLFSTLTFLGGLCLRVLIVASLIFLGYIFFEESLSIAFSAVFSSPGFNDSTSKNYFWIYELLGYAILIKGVLIIFGKNFTDWSRDTLLYMLMILTGMMPLTWLARGLMKESYMAQVLAKTSFMGMHMAQTISAAPREIENRYSKIIDLYQRSNSEDKRKELEELCASY